MTMEMTFPGGVAVNAEYKGFTIRSDQPERNGGENSAPAPFDLFLASIGTCAGFFALRFCQERDLDTDGLKVTLEPEKDPDGKGIATLRLHIQLPPDFPDKYKKPILRAVDQCTVKRHILKPPQFEVTTS